VLQLDATESWCKGHIQGGSNMTGKNCDLFTHNQSRSYLNHLVLSVFIQHTTNTQAGSLRCYRHNKHTRNLVVTINYITH
jgi:hypothetical protein